MNASDDRGAQGGSPVARRGSTARGDASGDAPDGISAFDTAGLLPDGSWRSLLREERLRLGLTQAALARLVNIAEITLRKYEGGARMPNREILGRILVALQVPQERAGLLMERAGYTRLDRMTPTAHPTFYYTLEEARTAIERVAWPRFVANNAMEVVAINRAIRDLCQFDLERERSRRRRPQLHFLSLIAERWFRDHVTNIDEVLATVISVLKGVPRGGARLEGPNPLIQAVLDEFAAANPGAVALLLRLWEEVPAMDSKVQWTYPLTWDEPGIGQIHFHCLVTDAGETDALAFNDWIPADAASHLLLERALERRRRPAGAPPLP